MERSQELRLHWFRKHLKKPFSLYEDYALYPTIEFYPQYTKDLTKWEKVFSEHLHKNFIVDINVDGMNGFTEECYFSFVFDVYDFESEEKAKAFIDTLYKVEQLMNEHYKLKKELRG